MSEYPNVQLPNSVILQPEVTGSYYQITNVEDSPIQKTVVARAVVGENAINFFTVWSGASYDAIGQWTDTQLQDAVTQMIMTTYSPTKP